MPKSGGTTGTAPTGPSSPTDPGAPSTDPANLTGNWQATIAAAKQPQSISGMAGSITQNGSTTAQGEFTSSVMRLDGVCFESGDVVPLQGVNKAGALSLTSYAVNGQSVLLSATLDSTNNVLNGTYAAYGGCADGASGTFTATRYAALNGTYQGTLQAVAPLTVTLNLTQAAVTTGSGTFLLTGTVAALGGTCTLNGQIGSSSVNFVQGNQFQLTLSGSAGASAILTGTLDPAATTLTNVNFQGNGGGCAGIRGTGTLGR